jgi:hypothetical protein
MAHSKLERTVCFALLVVKGTTNDAAEVDGVALPVGKIHGTHPRKSLDSTTPQPIRNGFNAAYVSSGASSGR